MFKTKYEDIVSISEIGKTNFPILTGELFRMAESENIAHRGDETLLLAIDIQNSFMEKGFISSMSYILRFRHPE